MPTAWTTRPTIARDPDLSGESDDEQDQHIETVSVDKRGDGHQPRQLMVPSPQRSKKYSVSFEARRLI